MSVSVKSGDSQRKTDDVTINPLQIDPNVQKPLKSGEMHSEGSVDTLKKVAVQKQDDDNGGIQEKDKAKRTRCPTAKGRSYQLATALSFMTSSRKRLAKQTGIIEALLDGTNVDMITNEMNNLDKTYADFTESYARACATLSTPMDEVDETEEAEEVQKQELISKLMEDVDNDYLSCKEKVCERLIKAEGSANSVCSSRSGRSAHSKSSRRSLKLPSIAESDRSKGSRARSCQSQASSSSSKSLKQKVKVASLKAKAEALKQTREAELSAELFRLDMQIKEAEAKERVYQEDALKTAADDATTKQQKHKHITNQPIPNGGVTTAVKRSKKPKLETAADGDDLHAAMIDMIKLQSAPKPEIDTFSGDPLEFLYFKANFREVVESSVPDERGRLTRLIKYTEGEAKDLIKHLVHDADSKSCYSTAMSLLEKEYGNPHLLSCSYLKELRLWKKVEENDASAFKKFYRFLLKCQAYKKDRRLMELDSTDIIKTVISKLHVSHQGRWARKSLDIRTKLSKEADFNDLVAFMAKEAEVLCDPAYSRNALSEIAVSTFATHCTEKEKNRSSVSFVKCPICNGNHDIEDCETYLQKDLDQRHKIVFQGGLCFGCLGEVGNDHIAKTCTKKRKCRVCSGGHPTTLHGGKSEKMFHTTMPSKTISMCVVPIHLWHKNRPERQITVYALLDDSSNSTFITDEALEALDIDESKLTRTSVAVTTANGNREDPATIVPDLLVKCFPLHSKMYPSPDVELPVAFSRSTLAIDKEEVPTPARIKEWSHLQRLMDKIPEYDSSIPVGMIIGGNCPRAVEPLEVIQSTCDGPFAKRTRLGWCIVGPVAPSESPSLRCYHTRATIPVKDVSTGAVANHCFTYSEPVQDALITDALKQMYMNEFNEKEGEKRALSQEDETFLQMMKKEGGRTEEGRYILPLPFRDKNPQLPNNRSLVKNRLGSLKRKLQRNGVQHNLYREKMDWLISNYAQRADTSADKPGQVWHLPHFGMYNKEKDKFRVVFDAKAQFEGVSLNQKLLQGPDLTNLLVGVLLRFRKENIAVMADIEAMFHQVLVPQSQRSFLRFFWWENGDLDADIIEYEMCVHLFGAVSSGSCANYALHDTADASEPEFGKEVSDTIRRNFYVDDMLKSLGTVTEATSLVKGIRGACASGGFNLTKFISNSREVLESIPLEQRASSVVDLDIASPLPIERALGVYWCVENDTLGFRITLRDTPLTKRSILGTISSFFDPHGIASPFVLPARKILQNITRQGGTWDDPVSDETRANWERWRADIPALQELKIRRCFKSPGFKAVSASLHCFSDASEYGYGQASYLRQVNEAGEVCVSLVMAKSRVVPLKHPTIPRLELVAALTSAKIGVLLLDELDMEGLTVTYWVDSMIVLGYIQNHTKRYRTFVANRTRKIRELSGHWPWAHVRQEMNPADDASRGLSTQDVAKVDRWFHGPAFLREPMDPASVPTIQAAVPEDDPEVIISTKINMTIETSGKSSILETLGTRISNWLRMKRTLATAMKFTDVCRKRRSRESPITVANVNAAETLINKNTSVKKLELSEIKKMSRSPLVSAH